MIYFLFIGEAELRSICDVFFCCRDFLPSNPHLRLVSSNPLLKTLLRLHFCDIVTIVEFFFSVGTDSNECYS